MEFITGISDGVYLALNGLSGRSWLLDSLIALTMDNALVKAAPIGACFIYAWHSGKDEETAKRRRSVLLVTLAALVLVLVTTKLMSERIFLPRPFVLSQQSYYLQGDQLDPAPRLDFQVPQAGEVRARHEGLVRGDVLHNDLGSFPSDHAGFYVALSLGIALACRWAGLLALGWTFLIVLTSRIVTGMHSPFDIVAGTLIGGTIMLLAQLAARRWGRRLTEPVARWTIRHGALSSALIFLLVFEASSTLVNTQQLLELSGDAAQGALGR